MINIGEQQTREVWIRSPMEMQTNAQLRRHLISTFWELFQITFVEQQSHWEFLPITSPSQESDKNNSLMSLSAISGS